MTRDAGFSTFTGPAKLIPSGSAGIERLPSHARMAEQVRLEVEALGLTTRMATALVADPRRHEEMLTGIALAVACKAGPIQQEALVEEVRRALSHVIANELQASGALKRVEGRERIGTGAKVEIDLGLGWKAEPIGKLLSHEMNVALVNALTALNIHPEDRRKIVAILLPVVLLEEGQYVFRKLDATGSVVGLDADGGRSNSLCTFSEVVKQRTTPWGDFPVYRKSEFAKLLEAVTHSEIPEQTKRDFVSALIRTQPFQELIEYSRPAYEGGPFHKHESGTRIELPTGQSFRVVEQRYQNGPCKYRLLPDNPGQHYYSEPTDASFVFSLVEAGRLPPQALDCIYRVAVSGNHLMLRSNYCSESSCEIDLSKPFNEKIDFPRLYLSFVLSRDPRVGAADRARLVAYFGSALSPKVLEAGGVAS